jgi:glyoxylase-like metal-dependent hydrolase (beta-lactamase superfamily II)
VKCLKVKTFVIGPLNTNCYVVYEDREAIIIDVGGDPTPIINFLDSKSIRPKLILATHGHFDHVLGVNILKKKYSIPFMIHSKDVNILKNIKEVVKNLIEMYGVKNVLGTLDYVENLEPDSTFKEEFIISVENISLKILETPGHTLGSSCFLGHDVLFSGDTLFKGSIGRMDFGGDDKLMKISLRKLKELPDNLIVYPGHGPVTTLGYEKITNPFLINPDML